MMLKSLPSRVSDTAEIDRQAFIIGQQGVTRGALAEAVKQVLRGALGHGFHPSAPEFRLLCDSIQRKQAEERARGEDERRQRRENEQRRLQHEKTKTPEARGRVAAMLARFNQDHEARQAANVTMGWQRLLIKSATVLKARSEKLPSTTFQTFRSETHSNR